MNTWPTATAIPITLSRTPIFCVSSMRTPPACCSSTCWTPRPRRAAPRCRATGIVCFGHCLTDRPARPRRQHL
ncbi:hypothetical protein J4732_22135 [Serratia marcescens]|uniref:Uncharacterized protein n=1 Tax=Serratia marcescens TaxID=615 RepID=A0A939NMW4_SERMA|nr:hypothetical protein [Serratia marcescens]